MFDFVNSLDFGLIKAVIVFFLVIFIIGIFRRILKRHRIVKVLIVGVGLAYIIYSLVTYIDIKNKIYDTNSYYVYGMIKRVESNTIQIDSIRSNLKSGGEGRINIKIDFSVKIIDSTQNDKVLKYSDLSSGYTIQVVCNVDKIENSEQIIKPLVIIVKAHKVV